MPEPTPTNFAVAIVGDVNRISWTNVETDPASRVGIEKRVQPDATFTGLTYVYYPGYSYDDTDVLAYENRIIEYYAVCYLDPFVPSNPTATSGVTRWGDTVTDAPGVADAAPTSVHNQVDTVTDTVSTTDLATAATTWASSVSDTVTPSDSATDVQIIKTTFAYYIGMYDGTVHIVSPDYLSDNGTSITSSWETIETHLGMPTTYKTVYKATLRYVDKTASTPIAVLLSKDGGASWIGSSKVVGTATGKTKTRSFWFNESGEYFKFRVECASTDKEFQIIGLDIEFEPGGETVES